MQSLYFLLVTLGLSLFVPQNAPELKAVGVSLIQDGAASPAVQHGWSEVKAALKAKGISYEEVADLRSAKGQQLIVAGVPTATGILAERLRALNIKVPAAPESLVIHNDKLGGRSLLLLTGADDRGTMYSLLEVASRIGWAANAAKPFSEVRDTVESPNVADRGVTLFTMQQAQFEDRLHDENYWAKYFDTLARDRFNMVQVLFAYEADGYMCPAYPYFMDTEGFPDIKVTGLSKEEQQRNLADLHRLIRMAHDRGIRVTLGLWCHYFRFSPTWQPADHSKPIDGKVFGLNEANLVPYTRAAMGQFLKSFPEVDGIQLLMHNESGLKTEDMKEFWRSIYRVMKDSAPNLQYEIRAKGVSDDLIAYGHSLGLKIRVNTKYWSEQVGLPFHPTHVQELNQFERRHGYADMLKYPREYTLHWTLWTAGTTRILLWGDPDYVRRFTETTHLGDAQGFEVDEPLATKMAGHPHDMKPFDLLGQPYRYYDYEFERYWHFFEVFGRLSYNPSTPSEEWDHEFQMRFGEAAPDVEQGLHRASQILPQIVAYCLPANRFPTTRGWPERQRQEDLAAYAEATPSDTEQFESLKDAAKEIVRGDASAKISPAQTSAWFAQASEDVLRFAAQAEKKAGPSSNKELFSTLVDLRILANLAAYHSHRIRAGLSLALFKQTNDLNALDDAISNEKRAIASWEGIVQAAGDVYNYDLMMGLPEYDLSGHWRDEVVKLRSGLAALERERASYRVEPERVIGRYNLGADPIKGYEQIATVGRSAMFEKAGSNVLILHVPNGHYKIDVGIKDEKKSHGPMWIEVNGEKYSDIFTVPAGQQAEKSIETSSVDGELKVVFDNATSADWYASTLTLTREDPVISHVPVRRILPGESVELRATIAGVAPIANARVFYGDNKHGYTAVKLDRTEPQLYRVKIPSPAAGEGMGYFIEATDSSGRTATYPEDGAANPIAVLVSADDKPPLLHQVPVKTVKPLEALRIVANVDDPSGVKWVRLRYRGLSQHQDFRTLTMLPTGKGDEYEATIPGEDIDPEYDFMYFFEAMDRVGNGKIYPDLRKETPYITVKVIR